MMHLGELEAWLVAGSQHLYGPETLKQVQEHATTMGRALGASANIPVKIVVQPVMTGSDAIEQLCLDANRSKNCVGLIPWINPFSPARLGIAARPAPKKPLLHS